MPGQATWMGRRSGSPAALWPRQGRGQSTEAQAVYGDAGLVKLPGHRRHRARSMHGPFRGFAWAIYGSFRNF